MPEAEDRVCVACGRPGATGEISIPSEKHPERTYLFFIHPACLKNIAKPGFVGLEDL